MSGKGNTAIIRTEVPKDKSLDDYLTDVCLSKSLGEVVKAFETATTAKAYWIASLFVDAIFNKNIQAIQQIVTRVDGLVPADSDRESYANILGDAIEDVMSYADYRDIQVRPDDPCIIGLAKAVYVISLMDTGNNYAKKKDKALAVDMILARTGGRKTEPTKLLQDTKYVEPEWARLPSKKEGEEDAREVQEG